MTVLRDWPRSLRRASYRGARFWVETDEIETGRRLVVHEFPHKDLPYVEDLGRAANRIQVTAYVASDNADAEERALRRACEAGGAATLVLPIDRMLAHCESCRRTFARDRQGYIAFTLTFVREGTSAGPFPVAYLAQLVSWGAAALVAPLSALFQARFATLGHAGYVKDSAADVIRDMAAALDAGLRMVPLASEKAPEVLRLAAELYADATQLADAGARGDRYGERSFVAEAETRTPALIDRLDAVLGAAAEAMEPAIAVDYFSQLAEYGLDAAPRLLGTPSARAEAQNTAMLGQALRILALGRYAAAVVARRYDDRRAAIQARADAAEVFDAELERLTGADSHPVYVALDELRGRVAEHLSRRITDLAPVLVVGAAQSMPSLWWANRLYGDAARAAELVRRNRVKHASFMPVEFEALAR